MTFSPVEAVKYMLHSLSWQIAIQLMLKGEPFFFDRFPKTGRRIALNLNEIEISTA